MKTTKSNTTKGSRKNNTAATANAQQQQVVVASQPTQAQAQAQAQAQEQEQAQQQQVVVDPTTAKAIKERDNINAKALVLANEACCAPEVWMREHKKALKKVAPQYAKLIEDKYSELVIAIKKAGSYYSERVVEKDKEGNKRNLERIHMCDWRLASKTNEIGRKITPLYLRYKDEDAIEVSKVSELTITRKVCVPTYEEREIDGKIWKHKIENFVEKRFRPVECLDLTFSEFKSRVKVAIEVVFPNGFC
jgi:mRNA-degrading endonuclease RelE of RelBE toxin-antitoxin system